MLILGIKIVQMAIRQPISTIVANAGLEPAVIVEKVSSNSDPSFGYDALKNCYVNMIEAGIIGLALILCSSLSFIA